MYQCLILIYFFAEKVYKNCRFCDNTGFINSLNEDDGYCTDCHRGQVQLFKMMKQMEIEDLQRRQNEEIKKIRLSWNTLIEHTENNGTYKIEEKEEGDEAVDVFMDECILCDVAIADGYGICCSNEYCDAVYCEKCHNEPMGLEAMPCGDNLCKGGCCGFHVRTCQCRETLFW